MRVSKLPRLNTIDEDALKGEVKDSIAETVHRLSFAKKLMELSGDLLRYARTGEVSSAHAEDPIFLIGQAMAESPWNVMIKRQARIGDLEFIGPLVRKEPSTALGVVLAAAICRWNIGQKLPVTPRQLGALAGGGLSFAWGAIKRDELALRDGKIAAKDAKRWAKAHGVEGL
jgi:hypothetical protein